MVKGKCGGGRREEVEGFLYWRFSRGEELVIEFVNKILWRVLKFRIVNILMFLKVRKDKV